MAVIGAAHGQRVHIAHCLTQCPNGANAGNDIVVRHLYAASVSTDSGLADWVAYRVLGDAIGVASLLPRYWREEELLGDDVALEIGATTRSFIQLDLAGREDYSYRFNEIIFETDDRGRLAPMTSFANTPFWEELNRLSNMVPMPVELRDGSWARLEMAVNELAATEGELHVISGPLYQISPPLGGPGAGNSLEPAAYFKVIAAGDRLAAFRFAADLAMHASVCDQAADLTAIEEQSGFELFPTQPRVNNNDLLAALGCAR